jgi:hypothetical protein
VSEPYPIRSGTEEDLKRAFGPGRLLIGFPVESTPEGEHEHDFVDPGDGQTATLKASSHRRTL